MNKEMMLQTNLRFQQRKIMKLNKKYNVLTFSTKIRGLKAFAAEQKIREFKKLLSKSKGLQKSISSQRLEPKELIQRAVDNMNKVASQKNGFSSDFEEEKTLNDENVWEIYDFHRLVKVRKFAERYERSDNKSDRPFHKKVKSPLEIGEKVLVSDERLKKRCTWHII